MKKRMSMRVFIGLLVGVAVILSACQGVGSSTPTPVPHDTPSKTAAPDSTEEMKGQNPFAPQPGDEELNRGDVQLDETQLMIQESYPVQVVLHIEGNLPTPCHQLRAKVEGSEGGEKVNVNIYSLVDPNEMCTQVLQPFDSNISLGSYEEQGVTFFVNGEKVGEY